ncbi:stage III sporulation protein AF [Turicibacter sanguinis]|uniref:stage III sporulation protein AF n=1 Tax=Turicibacter sanguinis TaxID=154288 RepID=UPI003995167C
MIYTYAKQIIAMFFLIAVVNLLVIPASYKKIISFYLHFFIIVIILKPVLSIMNNEVSSFINSITFISESEFDESVQYYQSKLEEDLKDLTLGEVDALIQKAEALCDVDIITFELDEVLTIQMVETSKEAKLCFSNQLGIDRNDILFEGGGQ